MPTSKDVFEVVADWWSVVVFESNPLGIQFTEPAGPCSIPEVELVPKKEIMATAKTLYFNP